MSVSSQGAFRRKMVKSGLGFRSQEIRGHVLQLTTRKGEGKEGAGGRLARGRSEEFAPTGRMFYRPLRLVLTHANSPTHPDTTGQVASRSSAPTTASLVSSLWRANLVSWHQWGRTGQG